MDMNRLPPVSSIPVAPGTPSAQAGAAVRQPVIELKQIKTILYMGMRGRIHLPGGPGGQLVDTFA